MLLRARRRFLSLLSRLMRGLLGHRLHSWRLLTNLALVLRATRCGTCLVLQRRRRLRIVFRLCFLFVFSYFALLLILFPLFPFWLHDVVHEVIDVFIIHLLVCVVVFGRYSYIGGSLGLALFRRSFLLCRSLALGCHSIVVH